MKKQFDFDARYGFDAGIQFFISVSCVKELLFKAWRRNGEDVRLIRHLFDVEEDEEFDCSDAGNEGTEKPSDPTNSLRVNDFENILGQFEFL